MPERYNLRKMLDEIREDTGEATKNRRLSQEEIKAMIRRRQEAQKGGDNAAQ